MIDKVKAHVLRHKTVYLVGSHIVVAGLTYVIMRRTGIRGVPGIDGIRGVPSNTASLIFRNKQTINVITVPIREGAGHPGYPVMCLNDKLIYLSQKLAAEAYDIPSTVLSAHLNGKFPDVDGREFIRVSLPIAM